MCLGAVLTLVMPWIVRFPPPKKEPHNVLEGQCYCIPGVPLSTVTKCFFLFSNFLSVAAPVVPTPTVLPMGAPVPRPRGPPPPPGDENREVWGGISGTGQIGFSVQTSACYEDCLRGPAVVGGTQSLCLPGRGRPRCPTLGAHPAQRDLSQSALCTSGFCLSLACVSFMLALMLSYSPPGTLSAAFPGSCGLF